MYLVQELDVGTVVVMTIGFQACDLGFESQLGPHCTAHVTIQMCGNEKGWLCNW